nr:MAG TPA: hypothetical protein [Bacteriophage sp.]
MYPYKTGQYIIKFFFFYLNKYCNYIFFIPISIMLRNDSLHHSFLRFSRNVRTISSPIQMGGPVFRVA